MPRYLWFLLSFSVTSFTIHTWIASSTTTIHPENPLASESPRAIEATQSQPPNSGKSSTPATEVYRCAAYTPWDAIDHEYRQRNPVPRTASGQLVSSVPFGIAGPREWMGRRVALRCPGFPPYDDPSRVWVIDDTGGTIRRVYEDTGEITFELRFTDPEHARQFGRRSVSISLIDK